MGVYIDRGKEQSTLKSHSLVQLTMNSRYGKVKSFPGGIRGEEAAFEGSKLQSPRLDNHKVKLRPMAVVGIPRFAES